MLIKLTYVSQALFLVGKTFVSEVGKYSSLGGGSLPKTVSGTAKTQKIPAEGYPPTGVPLMTELLRRKLFCRSPVIVNKNQRKHCTLQITDNKILITNKLYHVPDLYTIKE